MVDIQYLMNRYNISSKPGLIKFIKNHIEEINIDGEHAAIKVNQWKFDEIAVERLDKIRGFGIVGVVDERLESQKIHERDLVIAEQKDLLLSAQNKIIELTAEAAKVEVLKEENTRLIQEKNQIQEKLEKVSAEKNAQFEQFQNEKSQQSVAFEKEKLQIKAENEKLKENCSAANWQIEQMKNNFEQNNNSSWWIFTLIGAAAAGVLVFVFMK